MKKKAVYLRKRFVIDGCIFEQILKKRNVALFKRTWRKKISWEVHIIRKRKSAQTGLFEEYLASEQELGTHFWVFEDQYMAALKYKEMKDRARTN